MPTDEDGDATNGYQKNGVTFDEGYWTVKVTVSDGRDVNGTLQGYLNSTVEYTHYLKDGSVDPDSAKLINGLFVNKYTESGSYTLKGVKNITGRSFEAGDSFTFGITSADADAPMPSNVAGGTLTVTPTAGTSSCDVDFGTFTFDSSHVGKTYTYTLSEVTPEQNKLAGMTYDTTAYTLKLAITSDGLGTITATPTLTKVVNAESADVPEVAADVTPTWTNTFAATPVDVSIPVVKNIAWSSEESGTFEFKLIPGPTNPAGDPVTDAVNGLTATIKIDGTDGTNDEGAYTDKTAFSLTYTTEGTYQYRVRELVGDHLAGVSYSSALYEVTVTVTRNADATLSKAVKIVRLQDRYGNQMNVEVDAASFTNTYSDEAAEYSIRGLKWVDNEGTLEPAASNRYTMVLVPQGNAPAPTSASNATTFEAGVVDGYFAFGGIKFTHSDIGKTYSYIVYEKSAGSLVDGMLFDTRAYKIDLTISKNDKNVITVTPTYTLYASGYDTESGTLKGDGATWDKNNGTKVGIPEFFNKYTPQGASFEFTGDKTLVGRDALDGETFGFTLAPDTSDTFTASALAAGLVKTSDGADLAADGTLTATVKDAKNNQKSAFSFGSLSFLKAGTYTFKISEDQPDEAKAGLAYDTGTWTVSVTVSDVRTDGKLAGRLEVTNFTYALDDSATTSTTGASFTNTYTVAPTSAVMTAKKTLEGRTLEAGEFTFSLTLASSNTVVSTATNAADGTVTFDERTYTTAGERIYYITEENGGKNTIGYDKTTYKVKVNVVDDGAGKLSAQVTYYDAQGAETSEPPTFKNTFTPLATDTVSIDGEKLLTGRDAFGGETFGFTLTAADDGTKALLDDGAVTKKDGTALGADEELKADVSGAKDGVGVPFSFDVLTFSKAGTYAFTMKETVPGNKAAGLEYDTSTWTVTVTVAGEDDNGKKLEKLQATVAYAKNGVVVSDATKARSATCTRRTVRSS